MTSQDCREKEFLFRHSTTCFGLLDVDGSGSITLEEFKKFGFIFNISSKARPALPRTHTAAPHCGSHCHPAARLCLTLPFLWRRQACRDAFKEFDVDQSKELDFEEFKMFCLVCLDKQQEIDKIETVSRLTRLRLAWGRARCVTSLVMLEGGGG